LGGANDDGYSQPLTGILAILVSLASHGQSCLFIGRTVAVMILLSIAMLWWVEGSSPILGVSLAVGTRINRH
jgi:hypothetical protein